jgi:hypothetical protein
MAYYHPRPNETIFHSFQLMKLLYPEKNYTISANILEYRPPTKMDDVRLVRITDEAAELDRKSKFSFAIMDMLQITPATKLMFLQVDSLLPPTIIEVVRSVEKISPLLLIIP